MVTSNLYEYSHEKQQQQNDVKVFRSILFGYRLNIYTYMIYCYNYHYKLYIIDPSIAPIPASSYKIAY